MQSPVRVFKAHHANAVSSFTVTSPLANKSSGIHIRDHQNASQFVSTTALAAALEAFTQKAETLVRPFSAEGWKEKAPSHLAPIASATRALQQSAVARMKDLDNRWQELIAPAKGIAPERLTEARSSLRGLTSAEVLRRVAADPSLAIAILQMPDGIAGASDPDIRQHLERSAATYSLEKIFASQTQQQPSLDNPFAHGPDTKRAKELAAESLKNFQSWRDELDEVKAVISQAVHFYAVAADMPAQQAFSAMGLGA